MIFSWEFSCPSLFLNITLIDSVYWLNFFCSFEEILADSDNEFETMETDEPKPNRSKNKPSAWIEEDAESIVDFIDASVSSKITGMIKLVGVP